MAKFIGQRILYMFITLFIIASISFFLMKMLPGSPFSNASKLSPEQMQILLDKYHLDDPVPVQYANYLLNMVKGDLGTSFQFGNKEVTELIMSRIGPTMHLGLQAIILGALVGTILGIISALRQNTWMDYGSTFIAVLGKSIPNFVFAGLLQYYIGVKLDWLPVSLWKGPEYTIMPTIALSMFTLATTSRFVRTEMIEVLNSDYITLAKAKGASKFDVAVKHALRNALIPVITVLGPLAVNMMTGSLVIENIFGVPGIGEQFVKSINLNDYPLIMGTTMLYAFLFIMVTLLVDILYGIIDPRIRVTGGSQ